MKDNRVTIRITPKLEKQIAEVMKTGNYLKRSEMLREALGIGLRHIKGAK